MGSRRPANRRRGGCIGCILRPPAPAPVPRLPQELGETVQGMAAEDPPAKADAVVAEVKARKAEWGLEDGDVAKVRGGGGV